MVLTTLQTSFGERVVPAYGGKVSRGEENNLQAQETIQLGAARDFCQTIYQGKHLASLLSDSRFMAGARAIEPAGIAAPPTEMKGEFLVEGATADGFYEKITGAVEGKKVELSMTKERTYAQVGPILVEQEPIYRVAGECAGFPIAMEVSSEDLISSIGGINVQTGTIYHVAGRVNGQEMKASITHEDTVQDIGGINVQTATTARFKTDGDGLPDLTVMGVSVIENMGGLNVETDSYRAITGSDRTGPVDAKLHDNGRSISIEGTIPEETLALVLGLKPFLYAAG